VDSVFKKSPITNVRSSSPYNQEIKTHLITEENNFLCRSMIGFYSKHKSTKILEEVSCLRCARMILIRFALSREQKDYFETAMGEWREKVVKRKRNRKPDPRVAKKQTNIQLQNLENEQN